MPQTVTTTTITEGEIREAIAEWLAGRSAGEGPIVKPDEIDFHDDAGQVFQFEITASVQY